jgi:hypothetical protein
VKSWRTKQPSRQGDVGSSTLGLAMLAPNLVDTIHFPQMVRPDETRGRPSSLAEKFALNVIIWFICACAVFVIAVLGVVICPTEHVFSTSELASHSFSNSANNVYTAIRGEVFDLTQVAATHQRVVTVIPTKTVLQYGRYGCFHLIPCSGVSFPSISRTFFQRLGRSARFATVFLDRSAHGSS